MQPPTPPSQSSWRQEAEHLSRSGVTLAFNQLLQIAIPFVTTSMTGRLGVDELAAGSLVGSIGLLLFITTIGVLQGVIPLAGAGIGAGDDAAATRAIRGCLAIAAVMGIAATAIMAGVPWCLAHSGQDPALVALAQRFILALLPAYLPGVLGLAARFCLIAANDLKWLNPVILTGIAFNLACNLLFAGSGPEGLTIIGTVISLTNWLTFLSARRCHVALKADPKGLAGSQGTTGDTRGALARDSRRRDLLHRNAAVHRLKPADGLFRQDRARRPRHCPVVAQHRADDADRPVIGGDGPRRVPARPARTLWR